MIYILIFLNLIIASSQHITHDLGTRTIAIQIKYFYCLLFIISRVTSVKCIVYKFTALYLVYILYFYYVLLLKYLHIPSKNKLLLTLSQIRNSALCQILKQILLLAQCSKNDKICANLKKPNSMFCLRISKLFDYSMQPIQYTFITIQHFFYNFCSIIYITIHYISKSEKKN